MFPVAMGIAIMLTVLTPSLIPVAIKTLRGVSWHVNDVVTKQEWQRKSIPDEGGVSSA